jgi:hypothetical protein
MTDPMREYSRRQFLKVTAAAGAAVGVGGLLAACSAAVSSAPAASSAASAAASAGAPASAAASAAASTAAKVSGTFNWMTWGDHSYPAQLDAIAASDNIKANSTLFSDNIDAYTKLKQVGGQLDMVSGDALWVPHYFESGLIEAWDINSLAVAKQLYSIARAFPIWTKPEGYSATRSGGRRSRSTTIRRRSRRPPIPGKSCSIRSTRSGSSSRTSPSRSWPTWASTPAPRTPTA